MKKYALKYAVIAALFSSALFTVGCSDDDKNIETSEPSITESRWITLAGAVMGTNNPNPGDGNGGTIVYSISKEDAKDPSKTFDVFENGFVVPSNRTARLQSSQD